MSVIADPLFETLDARTLAELHDELAALVLERVSRGECGCGCGDPLPASRGGNGRQRYLPGHRQRAHRRRLEAEARALGVAPRLSLQALAEASTTGQRHGDAQKRRKPRQRRRSAPRPGVTVYLPTIDLAKTVRDAVDLMAHVAREKGTAERADDLDAALVVLEKAIDRRRRRQETHA